MGNEFNWEKATAHLWFSVAVSISICRRSGADGVNIVHLLCGILLTDNTVTRAIPHVCEDPSVLQAHIAEMYPTYDSHDALALISDIVPGQVASLLSTDSTGVLLEAAKDAELRDQLFVDDSDVAIAIISRHDPEVERLLVEAGVHFEALRVRLAWPKKSA